MFNRFETHFFIVFITELPLPPHNQYSFSKSQSNHNQYYIKKVIIQDFKKPDSIIQNSTALSTNNLSNTRIRERIIESGGQEVGKMTR